MAMNIDGIRNQRQGDRLNVDMQDSTDALSGTVYIPDTSALIENPDALDRLLTGGNIVVLLHQVLEELGRLQTSRTKSDGVRHAARQVTRKMLEYRHRQLINHGVEQILQPRGEPGGARAAPRPGACWPGSRTATSRRPTPTTWATT